MLNFDPHRWLANREGAESVATVATVARLHAEFEKSVSQESPATLATAATKPARNPSAVLREWHSHLAPLDFDHAPDGFTLQRWRQLHGDCWWIYENFASRAVRDGWTSADLFGRWPEKPYWGGIADRLRGSRSLLLTADRAHWRSWGQVERFNRGAYPDLRPFWECERWPSNVRSRANLVGQSFQKLVE